MNKRSFIRRFSAALVSMLSLGSHINSNAFVFQDEKLNICDSKITQFDYHSIGYNEYRKLKGSGLQLYRLPDGTLVYSNFMMQGERDDKDRMQVYKLGNPTAKDLENIPEHPLIKRISNAKKHGDDLFYLPLQNDNRLSLLVQRSTDGEKRIVCFTEHTNYYKNTLEATRDLTADQFKNSLKNNSNLDKWSTTRYFLTENLREYVSIADEDVKNWAKENGIDTFSDDSCSVGNHYQILGISMLLGMFGLFGLGMTAL